MKITLKNFRCYSNNSFDFGNEGIALLSGSSGAGKTSILLGIYFALFGTGTKLVSYGKSSCKVTLEFDGLTITRTKRPNRLVVKDEKDEQGEYEDDAGQSIINKRFGDTFKTTGYISQNAQDSFIMMSPIEKLGFLERFAFQDINLTQLKKRCKDLIHTRNETLLKTTSQLEMASLMVQEMDKPEQVKFPLKCSKKNRERVIKNEIVRNKNVSTSVKICKIKISSLQKEKQCIEVYEAKKNSKQDSLEEVIEKLRDLTLERDTIEYEGDEKVEEYEKKLQSIISQRELILLEERYEQDAERLKTMKEDENNEIKEKITQIDENKWKEYTKEEATTTIDDYKQIIKDLEKIADLESDLERYEVDEDTLVTNKELLERTQQDLDNKRKLHEKLLFHQQVLECPSCQTNLRLNDDKLEVCESDMSANMDELEDIDSIASDISKLEKKLSSLETSIRSKEKRLDRFKEVSKDISDIKDQYEELPSLKEMKSDLEYIITYRSSQMELDRQLKKLQGQLKDKIFSSSILSFERDVHKQKKRIEKMRINEERENGEERENEEELRKSIVTQKQNKDKLDTLDDDIVKLSKQESHYKKQISEYKEDILGKFKSIRKIDEVVEELTRKSMELSELEKKKEEHQENVDNIEKYKEYKKAMDTYKSWVDKVDKLKTEETENRRLYAASTMLKEVILEAESIAMLNVISSINMHTQPYLECFFPTDPISIKLVPFKETKKGKTVNKKPQINLQIEYKGMEADINMLSGGELSRVILAFALALGEMFSTPIMLLDECTSSLDQELTGVVMDGIRENFNGNLVLLIAHQVVKGQFDKVIQIGE